MLPLKARVAEVEAGAGVNRPGIIVEETPPQAEVNLGTPPREAFSVVLVYNKLSCVAWLEAMPGLEPREVEWE
jgi:hypothetical protein